MALKENSARRLYDAIDAMRSQPPNITLQVVLLNAYGCESGSSTRHDARMAAHIIGLLIEELDLFVAAMKEADYTPESYSTIVTALDSRLQLSLMGHPWEQVGKELTACLPLLRAYGESLPNEEQRVDEKGLQALRDGILELRKEVSESPDLPPFVKKFVLEQLEIILGAVNDYKIAGAKAFKGSILKSYTSVREHSVAVAEYEQVPAMSKLKKIQTMFLTITMATTAVVGLLGAADKSVDTTERLNNWYQTSHQLSAGSEPLVPKILPPHSVKERDSEEKQQSAESKSRGAVK